jgi:hypothetical protein
VLLVFERHSLVEENALKPRLGASCFEKQFPWAHVRDIEAGDEQVETQEPEHSERFTSAFGVTEGFNRQRNDGRGGYPHQQNVRDGLISFGDQHLFV